MNNPNPFVPQGSLLEQKNRKRTRFQVAVFVIFAVNILVITPLLIQGCKRESPADTGSQTQAPVDTGTPADTNVAAVPPQLPPQTTNPVAVVAPPPPINQPTAGATEYVIVKGDTFDSIHKKFSVSVKAIEAANPGVDPKKLQPGKKIQIPAATAAAPTNAGTVAPDGSDIYVVKANDSLGKIATAHGTTYQAIMALNNLKTTKIKVGDKLKLPPAKTATPPPPPVDTTPAPAPTTTAPAPAPAPR